MAAQALQVPTLPTATRRGEGWCESDDAVVQASISLSEMARITGRTYYAVESRRVTLGLNPRPARKDDDGPLLCPCASLDGDHAPWCPEA